MTRGFEKFFRDERMEFPLPADLPPEVLCRAVNAMFAVIVEYYDGLLPGQLTPQHAKWLEDVARRERTPEMFKPRPASSEEDAAALAKR